MSDSFERAKSRLNNLEAIEPLLGALKTMSMGALQMAQNKLDTIRKFEQNYTHILAEILPRINLQKIQSKLTPGGDSQANHIFLIIGSERGLCGKFNQSLANKAMKWIKDQDLETYHIWAMGNRMVHSLERMNIKLAWRNPLPASGLVTYSQAYHLTQNWIDQFESFVFDRLEILFMDLPTSGPAKFNHLLLLPYKIDHEIIQQEVKGSENWPPPIIETPPEGIYNQIIQHYMASSFHQVLLKSSAAEHAARYNLMEDAKDNAEEIIKELKMLINIERKRKITQEMQELASGAGLIR